MAPSHSPARLRLRRAFSLLAAILAHLAQLTAALA
jgi:hypothetical protein